MPGMVAYAWQAAPWRFFPRRRHSPAPSHRPTTAATYKPVMVRHKTSTLNTPGPGVPPHGPGRTARRTWAPISRRQGLHANEHDRPRTHTGLPSVRTPPAPAASKKWRRGKERQHKALMARPVSLRGAPAPICGYPAYHSPTGFATRPSSRALPASGITRLPWYDAPLRRPPRSAVLTTASAPTPPRRVSLLSPDILPACRADTLVAARWITRPPKAALGV